MNKINIALLSGGDSPEREVSLNSGKQVFAALDKTKYNVINYDPAFDLDKLIKVAADIDFALIIMHGELGEDGSVQGLLDLLKIPYQGSGILGSALAMNKIVSKRLYEHDSILVPPYILLNSSQKSSSEQCIEKFGLPLIIKPVSCGSSVGISVVKNKEDFDKGLKSAFNFDNEIIIEKYIDGVELTCGVIGNTKLETFPIIQIIPDKKYAFFDYEAKYVPGATNEICPAPIDENIAMQTAELAKKAHRILNCRGYSRTDMILKDNLLFVLETNTIPGMTPTSLLPISAKAAGIEFGELLDKLIELGRETR
ncbi:MAG: D-alanine--D-alanine ligase [Deltaproteobacteria bacterium]|nr:D-alanine--D-alanine ligase [Deltaproteobacteria bacterium]